MAAPVSNQEKQCEDTQVITEVSRWENWIYATEISHRLVSYLLVYRSVLVQETDECYTEVRDYIERHNPTRVCLSIVDDENIMYGKAEIELWAFQREE